MRLDQPLLDVVQVVEQVAHCRYSVAGQLGHPEGLTAVALDGVLTQNPVGFEKGTAFRHFFGLEGDDADGLIMDCSDHQFLKRKNNMTHNQL